MVMEGSISTGIGKQNLTSISIFWKCYVGNSTDFQTWDLVFPLHFHINKNVVCSEQVSGVQQIVVCRNQVNGV